MTEVVASIRRVTDIMGDISAASSAQNQGVQQVAHAVGQMDQTTQQNAALVEQMAAAASSLRGQAQDLVQVVSRFRLSHGDGLAQSAHRPGPVATGASALPRSPANAPKPLTVTKRPPAPALATAAATKPVGVAKAASPTSTTTRSNAPAAALPTASSRSRTVAKPADDNGDWETF